MLTEVRNVVTDVRTGSLPKQDIPGFIVYLLGKTFWFWFALIIGFILFFILG